MEQTLEKIKTYILIGAIIAVAIWAVAKVGFVLLR